MGDVPHELLLLPTPAPTIGCALHETQSARFSLTDERENTAASVTAPPLWLHATFEQRAVDLPGAFENGGGTMKMATFSGEVDLSITGASNSTVVRLADDGYSSKEGATPAIRITLALPAAAKRGVDGVVLLAPTGTIMVSHNIGALSTTGSGGESNAGFATTPLIPALRTGSALLNLTYGRWEAPQRTIALSRLEVRTGPTEDSTRLRWSVERAPEEQTVLLSNNGVGVVGNNTLARGSIGRIQKLSPTQAAQAFVQFVGDVSTARAERFVYPQLPGLTKSFAMAPVMGFTTVDAMLHVPSGLDADGLEAMIEGMVRIVLQHDEADQESMLEATKTPPSKPGEVSPWRETAAQAVHLAIRFAVEYREDGVVYTESTGGLEFAQLESWLGQATRSVFGELNDCDGSALLAMRIGRHIGLSPFADDRWRESDGAFVSIDPGYDAARHKWTRAVRNALSHTDSLVFTVVGASTGEGGDAARSSDAGTGTSSNTGGHAVPLFLPTVSMIRALKHGLKGMDDEYGNPKFDDVEQVRLGQAYTRVFYPKGKVRGAGWATATTADDDGDDDTARIAHVYDALVVSDSPQPMAIDGTVTSMMDLHVEGERASRRRAKWGRTLREFQRLGPTVADRVVDLTVSGSHMNHAFYRHFVEGAIVGAIGSDEELLRAGVAAPHFVFARRVAVDSWHASAKRRAAAGDAHATSSARSERMDVGASPADLARGAFALLPVVPVSREQVAAMEAMRIMLDTFSIPPRHSRLSTATPSMKGNVNRSIKAIEELDRVLEERDAARLDASEDDDDEAGGDTFLEMYLTPRAMWNNPHSVEYFVERVKAVAKRGRAELVDLRGVQDAAFAVTVGIYV
jgi:hypothetical protein